jgi:hypothetical protein
MSRKYHADGTVPVDSSEIFVFGSNLAGVHGAGAARAAYRIFGAKMGNGRGFQGNTYAIPTKDEKIESLPLEQVVSEIETFVQITKTHPNLKWFVTRVGCGLAGFKDSEIAPHFKDAINCSFAEQWREFLE